MIDAIDKVFGPVDDIWGKLQAGAISFYFLPIKDMGLTDELYIKMNSRGKPLTQFEHFKAELERELHTVDTTAVKRIIRNNVDDAIVEEIPVMHDENGVDVVDRIIVLKQAISEKALS